MSQDKRHHHDFVNKTVAHVDKHPKELLPVLKEFKEMVENDSRLFMLFESMFDQVRLPSCLPLLLPRCTVY